MASDQRQQRPDGSHQHISRAEGSQAVAASAEAAAAEVSHLLRGVSLKASAVTLAAPHTLRPHHLSTGEHSVRFSAGLTRSQQQQQQQRQPTHHYPDETTNINASNNNNDKNNNSSKTTDYQTMMHILKANIGTGVLAMPNAFKNVGLWLGFCMVPLIGAICIHCMNVLLKSHNHLCDRFNYESLDYDQVAALGLACGPRWARRIAKHAHLVVTIFLIFTQVGFCCVYVMFVVENLQVAVFNLFGAQYSTTTYLMLVFPVIGLTSCSSNLNHLARISTAANVLQLTGLALIVYDLLLFHTYGSVQSQSPPAMTSLTTNVDSINGSQPAKVAPMDLSSEHLESKVRVNYVSPNLANGLPLFFATAVYAFEGIGVVLPLVKEMRHPERIGGLNGLLNTSMSLVGLLYMTMGFFGYAKYGQFVQSSITLNLPTTTLNEIVRLMFCLAIGFSYSLQFYVPWTIIWPQIDEALFYSYRPREPRGLDKLQILEKLSAAGSQLTLNDIKQATSTSVDGQSSSMGSQNVHNSHQQSGSAAFAVTSQGSNLTQKAYDASGPQFADHNSCASTYATSYTMGASMAVTGASSSCAAGVPKLARNRLDDLMEPGASVRSRTRPPKSNNRNLSSEDDDDDDDDDDDELELPDVEWRPPPRGMRGKRKLVRYSVILLSVLFTFVAAAIVPRLDLFISLIGALASSCLAIIFPAIIELCTFWSVVLDEPNSDPTEDPEVGAAQGAGYQTTNPDKQKQRSPAKRKRKRRNQRWRNWSWVSLVVKDCLLCLFGLLGLLTGTCISLAQLSSLYMGVDAQAT